MYCITYLKNLTQRGNIMKRSINWGGGTFSYSYPFFYRMGLQ